MNRGAPKNNKLCAEGVQGNTTVILVQTNADHAAAAAAHLVGDVLGVRLALRSSAGQGAGSDVAQVDLALRRGSAPRLAPDDDGAARQHLERRHNRQSEMTETLTVAATVFPLCLSFACDSCISKQTRLELGDKAPEQHQVSFISRQ